MTYRWKKKRPAWAKCKWHRNNDQICGCQLVCLMCFNHKIYLSLNADSKHVVLFIWAPNADHITVGVRYKPNIENACQQLREKLAKAYSKASHQLL